MFLASPDACSVPPPPAQYSFNVSSLTEVNVKEQPRRAITLALAGMTLAAVAAPVVAHEKPATTELAAPEAAVPAELTHLWSMRIRP